jgi:hypothetical protein
MDGIFNTAAWRNCGVLPGWIVRSAGAERYKLPAAAQDAREARTYVYGYCLPPSIQQKTIRFSSNSANFPKPMCRRTSLTGIPRR